MLLAILGHDILHVRTVVLWHASDHCSASTDMRCDDGWGGVNSYGPVGFLLFQEPTAIPSRGGWVPEVGVSEEGVSCKIVFP